MAKSSQKQSADFLKTSPIDFQEILHIVLEKAWLIVLCLLVAGFIAAAYILHTPPTYEAHAVLQVEQAAPKVLKIEDVNQQDLGASDALMTMVANLTSRSMLLRVVETAKLAEDKTFPQPRETIYTAEQLAGALSGRISAEVRRGTRLIDITVEDTNAQRAQRIAQALVQEFMVQSFEFRASTSTSANEFLMKEAERLKGAVRESELALQRYKEEHQAVSLEDKQNIVVEKLKDLNMKLTAAKSERLKLEADLAQLQSAAGDPAALLAIQSVATTEEVEMRKKAVSDQEAAIANLAQRYRAKHPKFIQAQSELDALRRALNGAVLKAADMASAVYQAASATEQKFAATLAEQEKTAFDLDKIAVNYNVLAREVESNNAFYQSVLDRMKETSVTPLEAGSVRVVELPLVPAAPSKPKKVRICLLALGSGLFVGLALAFGLNALDSSLKTVDQAEAATGLPALGAIPVHPKINLARHGLVIREDPDSAVAEAFRSLRTAITLLDPQPDGTPVLFTSAVPSEGKSFCSANYAVGLGQLGLRTLIIDADLRRPMLSRIFFSEPRKPGLTDVLKGTSTLDEALHETGEPNVWLLPAGTRQPNPAELLAGDRFGSLIKDVAARFERIVIDSAPIHAVSDTLLLAESVRHVCLVIRAGQTPRKAVVRANHLLEKSNAKPAGFVLNQLPSRRGRGYYYYYYSGKYDEGVYGASEPAAKA